MLNKILIFSILTPVLVLGTIQQGSVVTDEDIPIAPDSLIEVMIARYCYHLPRLINDYNLDRIYNVQILKRWAGKEYNGYMTHQYVVVVVFMNLDEILKGYYTNFFFYKDEKGLMMFEDAKLELWEESQRYHIPSNRLVK